MPDPAVLRLSANHASISDGISDDFLEVAAGGALVDLQTELRRNRLDVV